MLGVSQLLVIPVPGESNPTGSESTHTALQCARNHQAIKVKSNLTYSFKTVWRVIEKDDPVLTSSCASSWCNTLKSVLVEAGNSCAENRQGSLQCRQVPRSLPEMMKLGVRGQVPGRIAVVGVSVEVYG